MKQSDRRIWSCLTAAACSAALCLGCAKEEDAARTAGDLSGPVGRNEAEKAEAALPSAANGSLADDVGPLAVDEMPISELRVPLEYNDDGTIRSQLFAGAADPAGGDMDARDIRVEFYASDGSVEMLIQADACRYSREEGKVSSDSNVRLEESGLLVTGTGFEWEAEKQIIKILADAKVVLRRGTKRSELLRKVGPNG
jgi:hypothetical protein